MTPSTSPRLGVIGLGNMGGRVGVRLATSGWDVVGYDTDISRAAERDLRSTASVRALVEGVDVVLLSLPDSFAVEAVVCGEDGVLAACRAGQVVVDLSTTAPASTRRLHAQLAARGVELLDAGVSGGAAAAEKGELAIMVGGSSDALERARPVLECFSRGIFYMGPSGAGHATKLLNNFLNAVSLSATAEVMIAARRAGLDLHTLLDVLNSGSGVNFATMKRFPRIVDGDYLEGGLTGHLMMKDIVLYVDYLRELGVPTLNAPGPLAAFGLAHQLGYGDEISNRVVDAIGDIAGGIRVCEPTGDAARQAA